MKSNLNILSQELPDVPVVKYEDIKDEIKSGDVLFTAGDSILSKLIRWLTGSPWSHVGFVMRHDFIDRNMVFESVDSKGVRIITLKSYMEDFECSGKPYKGAVALARLDDFEATAKELNDLGSFGADLMGSNYDWLELVRIGYRILWYKLTKSAYKRLGPGNKLYICTEYLRECFLKVGVEFPPTMGNFMAPKDFAEYPHLKIYAIIE